MKDRLEFSVLLQRSGYFDMVQQKWVSSLEKRASLPGFPVYMGMNAKSNVLAVPTKINEKHMIH